MVSWATGVVTMSAGQALIIHSAFVSFVLFVPFVFQKSNCTLTRMKRGCSTAVGRNHRSPPDAGS